MIDYAGLFPPTQLPLQTAITNYASYITDSDSWMIGLLYIPAATLSDLDPYVSLFSIEQPLSISTLGRKGKDDADSLVLLEEDLKTIASFREMHGEKVSIDFLRITCPIIESILSVFRETTSFLNKIQPILLLRTSDKYRKHQLGI